MKNILFVTSEIYPNSAQGVRYVNLLKHLSQHYKITHLTYNSRIFNPENCNNLSLIDPRIKNKLTGFLIKSTKKIFNIFCFPDKFTLDIKRYNRLIKQILVKKHFEAIVICMNPFSFYKIGKFIKNLNPQLKLIADLSDPFTGNAVVLNSADYIKNKRREFETEYIKYFDKIVVLNDKIRSYYLREFGLLNEKCVVLEQGVDEKFLATFQANLQKSHSSKDSIRMIYAGGFYKGFREPFNIYNAIEDNPIKIKLDVYGSMKKYFHPNKSSNIYYHGVIGNLDVAKKYAESDIIVLIDNARGLQVPGKTIECLAISKPILFIYENEESPTLQYVKEASGVITCKNEFKEIHKALTIISECYLDIVKTFDFSRFTWVSLANKYRINVIE